MSVVALTAIIVGAFFLGAMVGLLAGGSGSAPSQPKARWKLEAQPTRYGQVAFYAVEKGWDPRYPFTTGDHRIQITAASIDDLDARIEAQLKAEDRVGVLNSLPGASETCPGNPYCQHTSNLAHLYPAEVIPLSRGRELKAERAHKAARRALELRAAGDREGAQRNAAVYALWALGLGDGPSGDAA